MEAEKPILVAEAPIKEGMIVMIIAPQDFRDEELFQSKEIFEAEGIRVTVASTTRGKARGMLGGTIVPDITISEIDTVGIIIGSGPEATRNFDLAIIQELGVE